MKRFLLFFAVSLIPALADAPSVGSPPPPVDLLNESVKALIKVQEKDGQWPYDGVVKVKGDSPIGYRVGGTSIVATTLLHAAPDNKEARAAVDLGLTFVLKGLTDPLMEPSTKPAYDVRVWGHSYALEFLCFVRQYKIAGDRAKEVDGWIKKLVETLITEEIPGGGWNYANRKSQASFVTAPVTQAMLLARSQGEKVPDKIFDNARKVLQECRYETGSFAYSGPAKAPASKINLLPGSAARSAVCETTLMLLGAGKMEEIKKATNAFFMYWVDLEMRRQMPGTHTGDYNIAPYFFYYGHRYCAQAIQMLPQKERATARAKLMRLIMLLRDNDGMWNDRVFQRSRNYGTAMVVLTMLNDKAPLPPALTAAAK